MTVGFSVNKIDIDSMIGQISLQLRDSINRVTVLDARVSVLTDTDLQGLGYTADDVTLLRAALADLMTIQQIAYGLQPLPTAYDFRTNISKVTGVA